MRRAAWIVAITLAVVGNAIYLLSADTTSWWISGALCLPFVLLAAESLDGTSEGIGGGDDSPWDAP